MQAICEMCAKVFSKLSNLNRHVREVHNVQPAPVSYDKSVWNYKCLETNCNQSFQQNKGLMEHLTATHNKTFDSVDIRFNTLEDFHSWKSKIELQYTCSYVVSSRYESTNGEITYFNCNRSRTGKAPCQERQRQLKSQGSCKLDFCCTSQIKLVNENQAISVYWLKTHYGHSSELKHLRLQKFERADLANRLIQGVSSRKIVDQVRDNIGEQLKRIDLLTSKDMNNIKQAYKIEVRDGKRHENDAISIDLWVQECYAKPSTENPILLYKQQNVESTLLDKNDFCLCIMNQFQQNMLQKFGNNVIAIDGTHGLNNYNFELTTVIVVDEFGEGFPVLFMFTNRKDTYIYCTMFQALKERVGLVHPKTFMSDMDDTFYNAWSSCMTPVAHRLYCAWHIDRAWQKNLTKIRTKEKRAEVYKFLKVLQKEQNEEDFEQKLVATVNYMLNDEDTKSFGQYFQKNYTSNSKQWAYCYRINTGINTNMRLESMHKVIKYFYLEHKKVRRLDKGLHAVLKFLKDKSVDRIVKLIKGKNTVYTRNAFKRHTSAVKSSFIISVQGNSSWSVMKNAKNYNVKKLSEASCCKLICSVCKICLHMYSCDCHDFTQQSMICKHIHFLHMWLHRDSMPTSSTNEESRGSENETSIDTCLSESVGQIQTKYSGKISNIKSKIERTFQILVDSNLENLEDQILYQIDSHLNVLSHLINISGPAEISFQAVEDDFPANSNIPTQLRLFSTCKKRKATENMCKKPSKKEADDINNILMNKPLLYYSSDPVNDHNYCSNKH